MTEAEKIVWEKLSNNQLGVRIRRQHPIGNYIADYYCHKLKLVIEIDGPIHLSKENRESDLNRDISMNECGIKILRFTNTEVLYKIDLVMEKINLTIEELKQNNFKSLPITKSVQ